MARLPKVGGDVANWGAILNEFLAVEHNSDGSLKVRGDGSFYQKPSGGIIATDLNADIQTKLSQAASAYQRPPSGIPKSDLASTVQSTIDAASNLSLNVKSYGATGDGATDDTQSIQSALQTAATAGGASVLIPKGTYVISAELSLPSNCTLQGEGQNTILRRKTGSASNLVNIIKINAVSNVRITNLHIDAQKDDIIANFATAAQDGTHSYITCNGIYITGTQNNPSKNVTIDHCFIHDAFYGNICPDAVDGLIIESNFIYKGRDNQINGRINGAGGWCNNVTVRGNVVYGQGPIATANQYSGIQFIRGTNITISENVCYGFGNTVSTEGNGIGLEGCRHVTISSNICTHNLSQGIKLDRTVEGNPNPWTALDTYVPGDCVSYSGNNFVSNTYNRNSTPPATATSNTDWTYQAGAPYVQNCVDVTVFGNTCANNNFKAQYNNNTTGIFVQYSEGVVTAENTLYGNYIGITQGQNVRSWSMVNNTIYNNQSAGIAMYNNLNAYGPYTIQNNFVARNGAKGIDVVVPCSILGNTVQANAQAGISLAITGTVVQTNPYFLVQNNTLIDNGDSGVLVNGSFSSTVPIEVRDNFAPASTVQPRFLGENGTACRCSNNRVFSQKNELWYFSNSGSIWIDENTRQIKSVTANYTATADDRVILVAPAANTTITLPAPNATHPSAHPGRTITITKTITSANTVTVAAAGGTINAPTTVADNSSQTYISNGTNWYAG